MRVAVAIPCHRVSRQVLGVVHSVPDVVERIYAVDDACPEGSGALLEDQCRDPRLVILRHATNRGVGGAMVTAYRQALADGIDIVVKVDGDGQMDLTLLPRFVAPLCRRLADYTKGNRFHRPEALRGMPKVRLVGNAALSFITKLSSGYWPVMDPTNGYTAIHACALRELPLDKLDTRYFFETDMLFRLNLAGAVVRDIPIAARYGDERSGLRVARALPEFAWKHLTRMVRRYTMTYLVRDFNLGSLYSLCGALLVVGGTGFGIWHWTASIRTGTPASTGTVMLAAMPVLIGIQLLIAFLHHDVSSVPQTPLSADPDDGLQ